jgi:hypothetical protein
MELIPKDITMRNLIKRLDNIQEFKEMNLFSSAKVLTPEDLKGKTVRFSPSSKYSRKLFKEVYTDSKIVRKNEDIWIKERSRYGMATSISNAKYYATYAIKNKVNWAEKSARTHARDINRYLKHNDATASLYDDQLMTSKDAVEVMTDENYEGLLRLFKSTDSDIRAMGFKKVREFNFETNQDKILLLFLQCPNLYNLDRPTTSMYKKLKGLYCNFR